MSASCNFPGWTEEKDMIAYFVNLQCPLPAATAGVTLRATRGVGPDTCRCGTLH